MNPRFRRAIWIGVLILFGVGGLACFWPSRSVLVVPAHFVATAAPVYAASSNASLMTRITFAWIRLVQKFRGNSGVYSFSPSPTNRCSIQGLLNQCTGVTGQRYVMAEEVAAGSIEFGHSNVLSGTQWVARIETALQSGRPEWWDGKTRSRMQENLILLRRPAEKTVLVLRAHEAAALQK